MKETTPSHSWKQKDGKCKQNSWKKAARELIVLTCKEHSCVLSRDLRTTASSIFI